MRSHTAEHSRFTANISNGGVSLRPFRFLASKDYPICLMLRNIYVTSMPLRTGRARREELDRHDEHWACIAIPVLFWLFASMTVILGYYGTTSIVLGPNCSHLFEANALLVSRIEVRHKLQAGSVLYGFSIRPVLGSRSVWNETHNLLLSPDYHKEFGMWLNSGSKLDVTCFIRSSGFYSIVLTVSKGYSGLQEWIHDPTNPQAAAAWKNVHGQVGGLVYEVEQDGDYFIAVGNLDQQSVAIDLLLDVNATMYSSESADSVCSVGNGSCKVMFPLSRKRYALLTTPLATENGTRRWEMEISYGIRWISYFTVLACIVLLASATLTILNGLGQDSYEETGQNGGNEAQSPLLSPKLAAADRGSSSDLMTRDDPGTVNLRNEDAYDAQLCVICLDAPKSVFFIPCGHCATCLPCGQRIRRNAAGTCPICRTKIEKIRRLFQA